jgi:ATP-dependent Clp protease protease subunit
MYNIYSSYFKFPEAAVNLQRRALGKRNNVKRLFKGEAYCPTGYGITKNLTPKYSMAQYGDYQRQRSMTLGDLLLENRIIFLQGEIRTDNANEVVMKLLYLQSENRRKDIHFYINSPGGSVTATLAIYDTMQILSCPVSTYCVGLAASGGAVLLTGGTKGKRFALPHAKIMMHQPWGGVGGQVSDIEIQAKEIIKDRAKLNEIIALHTGKTVEEIAKDTDRDFYLDAEEAKIYGVVDDILRKSDAETEKD